MEAGGGSLPALIASALSSFLDCCVCDTFPGAPYSSDGQGGVWLCGEGVHSKPLGRGADICAQAAVWTSEEGWPVDLLACSTCCLVGSQGIAASLDSMCPVLVVPVNI